MFGTIFSWLGSFLSGPIIQGLLQGYSEKLKAQNNSEKISADLQQASDAIQAQVVIAEQSRWFPFVRWGFAFPFMAFEMKAILWDRMLHMGHTDDLLPSQRMIEMVIIGAYFGHDAYVRGKQR